MFLLPKEVLLGNFDKMIESIKCPYCENGKLVINSEHMISAGISHIFNSKYWWMYLENDTYENGFRIFANCFQCNNLNCNESAIITGVIYSHLINIRDEYIEEMEQDISVHEYQDRITIKHIEPPIDLFPIQTGLRTSLELIYELKKAFYLFWVDKDACANKIRRFVEMLLDDMKIPPAYNLHKRIENHMQKSRNKKIVALGK